MEADVRDPNFELSLGDLARPCFKMKNKKATGNVVKYEGTSPIPSMIIF